MRKPPSQIKQVSALQQHHLFCPFHTSGSKDYVLAGSKTKTTDVKHAGCWSETQEINGKEKQRRWGEIELLLFSYGRGKNVNGSKE